MSVSNRTRSQSPKPPSLRRRFSLAQIDYLEFIEQKRKNYEQERATLSIYTSPLRVFGYFLLYSFDQICSLSLWVYSHLFFLLGGIVACLALYISVLYDGPHQMIFEDIKTELKFYGYWLLLGIASSIGLGTGLHTFVLFLGPHVAEITMVAYECGSLNFEIRGIHKLSCALSHHSSSVTPSMILLKVLPQSVIWGFGTALGELPPYFIARAAAYAGKGNEEMEELELLSKEDSSQLSLRQWLSLSVYRLLLQTGFLGIFACASIPNPLFDLAGITCGHFMIPFATFFSAVVLGKAFVKTSLQVSFIILLFSRETIQAILSYIKPINPFIHDLIDKTVKEQISNIRSGQLPDSNSQSGTKIIPLLWNSLIALMMLYFLFSIIESLAHTYLVQHQELELTELANHQRKRSKSM